MWVLVLTIVKSFSFFELLPFANLQIWDLNICNLDNSKNLIARSFKFGQLIEDDE